MSFTLPMKYPARLEDGQIVDADGRRQSLDQKRVVEVINELHEWRMGMKTFPSASVSSWISVKDRLPEKDGTYFVLKDGDATCEANTTPWYKGEWIWNDGSIIRLTDPELQVEFWMPIPEKPNAIQ